MKRVLSCIAWFTGGILAALVVLLIYGLAITQNAIIQDTHKQYYHATRLVIYGDVVIGFLSDSSSQNKNLETSPHSFKVMLAGTIAQITFRPFESVYVPPLYLGTYHINASGHDGILVLQVKDGLLYGAVRFPDWANGVWEPLKGVVIKNNTLYFTRSVTNE
ncbi:MAG TPA: hypothetical protein PLE64_10140, partial [Spirochaetota bacterium]|nr:hypothetical protein [Spirochaetota bacterium]